MEEVFLQEAKNKLLKEKKRILKEIEKLTVKTKSGRETTFPEYGSKEDENAAESAAYQERINIKKSLEELLEKIDKVLLKIEKGTYGICENCGKRIEGGRLKAYPEAILCVSCSQSSGRKGIFERFKNFIQRK